jgi:CHAT domain-containing protein
MDLFRKITRCFRSVPEGIPRPLGALLPGLLLGLFLLSLPFAAPSGATTGHPFQPLSASALKRVEEAFAAGEDLFLRGEYAKALEKARDLPLAAPGSLTATLLAGGYGELLQGLVASRRGFDREALRRGFQARETFEKTGSSRGLLLSLELLLRSAHALGLEEERLALEEELQTFAASEGDSYALSLALLHRGIRAFEARNCPEARRLWQECFHISQHLKNPEIPGLALKHAARCAWLEGSGGAALEEYARALEFARKNSSPWLECLVSLEYAEILARYRGDHAGGERLLLRGLEEAERLELGAPLLWICNNLGALYLDIGSFSRAEEILEKARELEGRPEFPRDVGLWVNLGSAALGAGDFEKARGSWLEARKIALEGGDGESLPGIALNLGILAKKQGNYPEAAGLFSEALAGFHEWENEREAAGVVLQLASLLILLEEPRQAREALGEAVRIYSSLEDRGGLAYVLLQEGRVHLLEKNPSRGRRVFEKLLQEAQSLGSRELQLGALEGLGECYLLEHRPLQARGALEEAAELLEEERRGYAFVDRRVTYLDYAAPVYELLFETLLDLEDLPGALEVLERLKARSFLDLMTAREIHLHPREEELLRALEALQVERGLLRKRESYLAELGLPRESPERKALAEALRSNQQKAMLLEEELSQASPRVQALAEPPFPEFLQIREELPPSCTFLHYYFSSRRGGALLVSPEALRWVPLEGRSQGLRSRISSLLPQISEAGNPIPEKELRQLYALLVQPLEPFLSSSGQLVVIPHGALGYLPLEILLKGERYLVEEYLFSYAPSLVTSLELLKARKGEGGFPQSAFLVGNPLYPDPSLPSLPAAEEEARIMGQFFATSLVLTGQKATESAVKREAPSWELLHWATHARGDAEAPLKSEILFAPDQENDGFLQAWEILSIPLQGECVVLSACETALGQLSSQEGLLGLVRSFLAAGAPSLVASLWSVYDDSTRDFFLAFYSYWKGGLSKAEALRKAKIRLRTSYEHPAFWAPFILYGW